MEGERRAVDQDRAVGEDRAVGFEEALGELESILRALDREELRLDEALSLFERGVARLRAANRLLDDAKGAVEELIAGAAEELRTVELELEEGDIDAGAGEPGGG